LVNEHQSTASFPVFRAVGEPKKNALEKLLSLAADVRAGEGVNVVLLAVNVFLLFTAYYILKTAREPLILTEGSAEVKSYSSAAQAALLAVLVPLYGLLATKVGRGTLMTVSSLFFTANLVLFWIFGKAGAREGVAYYIWTGVFNTFAVSQFWQFANDLFTESQGKRLFPLIGVGASLGAWLGAKAAGEMAGSFDPYTFMLIGAIVLVVCLGLTRWVNARTAGTSAPPSEKPLGPEDGFALLMKDRYLLFIAFSVMLLNIANTAGEYMVGKLVAQEAERIAGAGAEFAKQRRAFIGEFYGDYYSWVNLAGFLFQTFLVSRLFRYVNVTGALFVLPVISLCGYALLAIAPVLNIVRYVKILENATDYSVNNTTRNALFLATSREAKYKAKAAIDTFFMRGGDVIAAGVVYLAASWALGLNQFALVVVGVVLVWLFICWKLVGLYRQRSAAATPAQAGR